MTLNKTQQMALAATRVSLGLLLFWWGLNRILSPEAMVGMQTKYYFDLFPSAMLQYAWGYVQVGVSIAVIVGFKKDFAVPAQLIICGFSSATIITALLDPFALWLPFEKISPAQHLFYPSVIAMCAGFFLYTMRQYDVYCLDYFLKKQQEHAPQEAAA